MTGRQFKSANSCTASLRLQSSPCSGAESAPLVTPRHDGLNGRHLNEGDTNRSVYRPFSERGSMAAERSSLVILIDVSAPSRKGSSVRVRPVEVRPSPWATMP